MSSLIERVRKQVQKNRYSRNLILRASTLLLRTPAYAWQFATDGFYRSTILNRFKKPESLHLTCNYTKMDRYPEIFQQVKELLADRPPGDITLLSFGCSTGEEAFSLRGYFPQARIIGVDISEWNLRQARAQNRDERIEFHVSSAETLERLGPFDAILCMAVLLRVAHRMEPPASSADVYPFEKFDEQVAELDGHLRQGGALVIYHANYRLGETSIAPRYEALPFDYSERDLVPKYGRDHQLQADSDTQERVFVKRS